MTQVLVNKLCERFAVEEGGVKLYDAILAKLSAGKITDRLTRFRRDEAAHRDLLAQYLDKLDVATDARETPAAILARHEGEAFLKLIAEADGPSQVLNILLTVELMDENGWELLINLGRDCGDSELVSTFERCLRDEKDHLRAIRGMVAEDARLSLESESETEKTLPV